MKNLDDVRIEFNKVSPFRIEIKIMIGDKTAIHETIDLNPEFFDEESADMYARVMAMIMQMSAGMFRNLFRGGGENP